MQIAQPESSDVTASVFVRFIQATVPVDRNVFSCVPAPDRTAVAQGRDRIPAPADLIRDQWTETEGMSVSQDPGFVAEYETPGGRLEYVVCAIHREHSEGL
ncbi:hypothetical protein [Nitrospira sp. BLG_2]|uniref:hypothetical protein n=1 Tax=Nitrospira sp. BLG_2 TaxID=3397507 RepID=UPI003B9C455B